MHAKSVKILTSDGNPACEITDKYMYIFLSLFSHAALKDSYYWDRMWRYSSLDCCADLYMLCDMQNIGLQTEMFEEKIDI